MFFLSRNRQRFQLCRFGRRGWLANRVLERLRGPLVFLQCESESANRFRYSQVLLKFSAQKFASSVNL